MTDTLQWDVPGVSFADGSRLATDWRKVAESGEWHWQYDTHELTFEIYSHAGNYWKLYRARYVPDGQDRWEYGYGGQACRVALVRYLRRAKSPHSAVLKQKGEEEWVRTYEVDPSIHQRIDFKPVGAPIPASAMNGAVAV